MKMLAEVKPVQLSTEPSGECVAGCGKEAYPFTDTALLPYGYVDTCEEHAARAILDTATELYGAVR